MGGGDHLGVGGIAAVEHLNQLTDEQRMQTCVQLVYEKYLTVLQHIKQRRRKREYLLSTR